MKVLFIRSGNHGEHPITENQADSLIRQGIEVRFYDVHGKGIDGYIKNISSLRKFVLENDIDLIHAHYSFSGFLASLSFLHKPILVSLMGSDVNEAGFINRFILKLFIKHAWSVTIVKSRSMQDYLGIMNIIVLPNGVDLDKFKAVEKTEALNILGWSDKKKHILFCSDPYRKEKNFDLLKQAVPLINDYQCEIHFLKGIKSNDIHIYYSAADVLVLTSKSEGSPNVIKEAMACNCPIVSTDVGDVREIISNTEGCFISGFSPNELSAKLRMALDSGKRTKGRDNISHVSSTVIALKLVGIYGSVLEFNS
jgi:glycosyltransferase involved in cell wall biosynthesis